MKDKSQRRFWLDDEVQHSNQISMIWGIAYGIICAAAPILAYEAYTGFPVYDLILRLLGDNGM